MKNIFKCLGMLFALVLWSEDVSANFADTWGMSAAGIARGNAMTAVVSGWSSAYYNMAGLGKTRTELFKGGETADSAGKQLIEEKEAAGGTNKLAGLNDQVAFSLLVVRPKVDVSFKGSNADENLDLEMISIGLTSDIRKYIRMPEFISSAIFGMALGMSAGGSMMAMNDTELETHNFLRYGSEAKGMVVCAGMGLGFMKDLFGIGLGANMTMGGEGEMAMPDIDLVPVTQYPYGNMRMNMKGKATPNVGLYYSPAGFLDLGAAYRGETYVEMDPFSGDMQMLNQSVQMDMYMSIVDFYTPEMYSFGLAVNAGDITVSGDIEYQKWSGFKHAPSREIYLSQRDIPVSVPEFKDIFVRKIGVCYRMTNSVNIVGGYWYQPSFVPDKANENLFNFLDNDKHVLSAGAEVLLAGEQMGRIFVNPVQLNVALQYQKLVEREVKKNREDNYINNDYTDPEKEEYWNTINPDYKYGGQIFSIAIEVILRT